MTTETTTAAHRNTVEQLVRTCRVRHTPNALHAYTATLKGRGVYGWGDTPVMARDCLRRMLKYDDGPNSPMTVKTHIGCVEDAP